MKIIYFGHDIHDAAITRRVRSLTAAGHEVTGFMMRRGPLVDTSWHNIDLGETRNAAYMHRLGAVWRVGSYVSQYTDEMRSADVIIARNMDMMLAAVIAMRKARISRPLIYECLDVHHKLTGTGPAAATMRRIERMLLRRSSLLVVSSPAFEHEYFARYHGGAYRAFLYENRLPLRDLPPRPQEVMRASGVLRIGWFGVLRCRRSLELLAHLARQFGGRVDIITAGKPVIDGFKEIVCDTDNMTFLGSYKAPEDLSGLYAGVDAVWAGDFYQADFNSLALLPNRLYEGGYFGVPAIAPSGTQTAAWLHEHETGFVIDEPLGETLAALASSLLETPGMLEEASATVRRLPDDVFVEPDGFIDRMLAAALAVSEREVA